MKNSSPKTLKRAKTLRKNLTSAEDKLWQELRRKQLGYHFRRQHPVGYFIVDFACVKEKLVIEVDGIGHSEVDEIARDAKRTAYLNQLGWRVIRFPNIDIFDHLDAVVEAIWHNLKQGELT